MSEDHDSAHETELPTDRLDEYDVDDQLETATSLVVRTPKRALVALLAGSVLLLSALRSLSRGQFRAVPKGVVGAGLLGYGVRRGRDHSSDDAAETFEPSLEEGDGETDGKETSDQAHAAAERDDSGRESQIDAEGEIDNSAQLGDERDDESDAQIEFADELGDEPRSKPEREADAKDPRRNTDGETEVDVSDTAMAEEVSEATGPDPEQAQPTQTDADEPEETPEEDASTLKVEPDEDGEAESDDSSDDDS